MVWNVSSSYRREEGLTLRYEYLFASMSMDDSAMLSCDRGVVVVVEGTSWSGAEVQLLAMAVVESTGSPSGIYLLGRLAPDSRVQLDGD
jgi:hypothetical protein